jgi:hypothetical protein
MPSPMVRPGRNELCSCGSGLKYKRCCGAADLATEDSASRFFNVAAVAAGLTFVVAVFLSVGTLVFGDKDPKRVWSAEHGHWHDVGGGEPTAGGPGKVWSEEHGHWHDAAGGHGTADLQGEAPNEGALEGFRANKLAEAKKRIDEPN